MSKVMGKKYKIWVGLAAIVGLLFFCAYLLRDANFMLLQTKGVIADKQRNLIVFASLLSLVVVIPVFTMLFLFANKYNEKNNNAKYTPNWDNNTLLEVIWWGVPILLISILSVVTWQTSHSLDPYKQISSNTKPITVEVVAMQWKWLFIYPEQNIASLNFLQFPEKTPVKFKITADAPMNSFWIPQLGGQIYAMPGMQTMLNLMASSPGSYYGSSSNLSGEGFAGMHFEAKAVSSADFYDWVQSTKSGQNYLGPNEYANLAQPSKDMPQMTFAAVKPSLFENVMMKYMQDNHGQTTNNDTMNMQSSNENRGGM